MKVTPTFDQKPHSSCMNSSPWFQVKQSIYEGTKKDSTIFMIESVPYQQLVPLSGSSINKWHLRQSKKHISADVLSLNQQLPILPGRFQPSTFGVCELNYRVRHGYGCILTAIATESLRVYSLKTI